MVCWNPKVAISLKRIKIEETLLWRAHKNSRTSFGWYHSWTPCPLSLYWRFATPTQNSSRYNLMNGKDTDFKFGQYIHRVHPDKSPLKIWEKGSLGVSKDCPNFLNTPIISGTERVKLQTSNFAGVFTASMRPKAPYKFWRKGSVGVSRDCRIFSSTPVLYQELPILYRTRILSIDRNESPLQILGKVAVC